MVENAFASGTPEERFAARVQRALETFAAKGPAQGHMGSDWDKAIRSEMAELLRAPDGFEIALAMARSPLAAIRRQAATFFNLKDERQGLAALRVLLQDPAADVRRQALRAYAGMIFPGGSQKLHLNIFLRAPRVVPEVADLLPLTQDPHEKVRLYAVQLVGTYATLGDAKVDAAVAAALKDTSHKVQHSAARALGATCPGCGTAPAFARPTG